MKRFANKPLQGALAGLACAIVMALLYALGALEPLELKAYDLRFRLVRRHDEAQPPGNIALVTIDQSSLNHVLSRLGMGWPWPRAYYGKVIEFLASAGARAIVFDVFFTEPDVDRMEITAEESDGLLCAATAVASNVHHAVLLQQRGEPPPVDEVTALRRRLAALQIDVQTPLVINETMGLPSAALIDAACSLGAVNADTDRDNVFRRAQLLARVEHTPIPALPVTTYASLVGATAISATRDGMQIGKLTVPLNGDGSAYVWWYRPRVGEASPFRRFTFADALTSRIQQEMGNDPILAPDTIRDKIVFIGSTATGLYDIKANPLSRAVPGVELQATVLANLLRGDFVRRWPTAAVLFVLLIACLATGTAARAWRHNFGGLAVFLGALAALAATGQLVLNGLHQFAPVVTPMLGVALAFFTVTVINHVTERRQSRLVRGIFEHYVDRSVVQTLLRDPHRVRLGGEARNCSVMFSDVAGFTSISEALKPEQVVQFMNIYLNAMTDIIIAEGGFVDKFVGDEIVAIFGAPSEEPDHTLRSCRAILRMARRLEELQPLFEDAGVTREVFARTGISSGEVVVGNMGSESRMNYTAMGNAMNLGARIEGVNKVYGTRTLVSENTVAYAKSLFVFREIDAVRVKGKDAATRIYELIGFREDADADTLQRIRRFEEALGIYRAGNWADAAPVFEALAKAGDAPSRAFADRCAAYAANPPPAWDGIYTMQTK